MRANHRLKNTADLLEKTLLAIAAACLILLMTLGFSDVFARYVFSASIVQREELFRVLLIVIFATTLPVITLRREHLDVDLLDSLFADGKRRQVQFFMIDLIVAICCGTMSYWLYDKSLRISRTGREVMFEELGLQQGYFAQGFALVLAIVAVIMAILAVRHALATFMNISDDLTDIHHSETL